MGNTKRDKVSYSCNFCSASLFFCFFTGGETSVCRYESRSERQVCKVPSMRWIWIGFDSPAWLLWPLWASARTWRRICHGKDNSTTWFLKTLRCFCCNLKWVSKNAVHMELAFIFFLKKSSINILAGQKRKCLYQGIALFILFLRL